MVKYDQMFIFQHLVSPAVHTLLPSVLQRLDSCCTEALILILGKVLNCRYDLIIGPILLPIQMFFHVGEQKVDGAKSGEYGGWSTSSKPQSCTAAIATTDLCAGSALLGWNRTPFVKFPDRLWNISSTTFQSPELYPVWVYVEGDNVISIGKGWIWCMPSFIAVARKPPSESAYELCSAHPCMLCTWQTQFSLSQIRSLAKGWRLSCKPRMRSDRVDKCLFSPIENVHMYHKNPEFDYKTDMF